MASKLDPKQKLGSKETTPATRTAANKARKIARHCKRMGLSHAQMVHACNPNPGFPRLREPLPAQSAVFGASQLPKQSGRPLHIVTCNGVLLEITPSIISADSAKKAIFPKLGYRHEILNPTGRRTLVDSRNAN